MKVFNLAFLLPDDRTLVVVKNTLTALKSPLLKQGATYSKQITRQE